MTTTALVAALARAITDLDTRPEPRAQQAAYRDAIVTAARAVVAEHKETTALAEGRSAAGRTDLDSLVRRMSMASSAVYLATDAAVADDLSALLRSGIGALLAERDRADLAEQHPRDEHHTMEELYDYRMLYNALAFNAWAHLGTYPVVKSWRHSDGELCFGGGWFIVTATLPTGLVSNHYRAEHWDLFWLTEATPPEYDGHTPAIAAERMRRLLTDGQVA